MFRLRNFRQEEYGQAMVEFVIVFPVLFVFFLTMTALYGLGMIDRNDGAGPWARTFNKTRQEKLLEWGRELRKAFSIERGTDGEIKSNLRLMKKLHGFQRIPRAVWYFWGSPTWKLFIKRQLTDGTLIDQIPFDS